MMALAFPHDNKENDPPETAFKDGLNGAGTPPSRKFGIVKTATNTNTNTTTTGRSRTTPSSKPTSSSTTGSTKKVRVKSAAKKKRATLSLQEQSALTPLKPLKQLLLEKNNEDVVKPLVSIAPIYTGTGSSTNTNTKRQGSMKQKHRQKSQIGSTKKQVDSNNDSFDEYTITFQPGPIGMQLEPVLVQRGGVEVGCRVLKFVDTPGGQARQSGKIRPGDLLIAVNHTDVVSWSYPDVIRFLKMLPTTQSKRLTFRTVKQQPPESITSLVASPTSAMGSKERVLTNHVLNRWNGSPFLASSSSSPVTPSNSAFSPSKVKEHSASLLSTSAALDMTLESADTMSVNNNSRMAATTRVLKRVVAPAAYNVAASMSNKFGHALAGHSSTDFNQAVNLKMQLLTELSHAKITLDAKAQEKERLDDMVRSLSQQVDLGHCEREGLQAEIQRLSETKGKVEQLVKELVAKHGVAMEEQSLEHKEDTQNQLAIMEERRTKFETEQQGLVAKLRELSIQLESTKESHHVELIHEQQRFNADRDKATLKAEMDSRLRELTEHSEHVRQEMEARSKTEAMAHSATKARLDNLVASHEAVLMDGTDKEAALVLLREQAETSEKELRQAKEVIKKLATTKDELKAALQSSLTRAESSIASAKERAESLVQEQEKRSTIESQLELAKTRSETQQAAIAQLQAKLNEAEMRQTGQVDELLQEKKLIKDSQKGEVQKRERAESVLKAAEERCLVVEAHVETLGLEMQANFESSTLLGDDQHRELESQLMAAQQKLTDEQRRSKSNKDRHQYAMASELKKRLLIEFQLKSAQQKLSDQAELLVANELDVARLEMEVAIVTDQIESLQTHFEKTQEECSKHVDSMSAMETTIGRLDAVAQEEERLRVQAESELAAALNMSSDQGLLKAAIESEKSVWEIEFSNAKNMVCVAQADLALISEDLDTAESERDELQAKVSELKVEMSVMQLEAQELHKTVDNLGEESLRKEQLIDKLCIESKDLRESKAVLLTKAEELELSEQQLIKEKAALYSELTTKSEELVDVVKKQSQLESTLSEMDHSIAVAIKETRERLTLDFREALAEKEGELSESTATISFLKENHAQMLGNLSAFQSSLEASTKQEDGGIFSLQATQGVESGHKESGFTNPCQTAALDMEQSELKQTLAETKISLAASVLGTMKESGQSSQFIKIFIEKEQELFEAQTELVEGLEKNSVLKGRLEQLEYFLQDSLQQNETDGDDARVVRSTLEASEGHCKALEEEVRKYKEDMTKLQDARANLNNVVSRMRKDHHEVEVRAEVQSKLIQTLQSEFSKKLEESKAAHDVEVGAPLIDHQEELKRLQQSEVELKKLLSETNHKLQEAEARSDVQATVIETLQFQIVDEMDESKAKHKIELATERKKYLDQVSGMQASEKEFHEMLLETRLKHCNAEELSQSQAEVIRNLKAKLSTELDQYKERQEFKLEEIEEHVITFENEIINVVQSNEELQCTLLETEMELKASKETAAALVESSTASSTAMIVLQKELQEAADTRDALKMQLLDVQSSLDKTLIEHEFLQTKAQDLERNVQLQVDRQTDAEALQEKVDTIVQENNELLLTSNEDKSMKEKYKALKSALASSLHEIESQRKALVQSEQDSLLHMDHEAELSTRLAKLEIELDKVSRERSDLQLSYEEAAARCEGLQKSLIDIQLHLSEKDELNSATWSEMQKLKASLHRQTQEGVSAMAQIHELKEGLADSSEETTVLQAAIEIRHAATVEQQQYVTSLQYQLDSKCSQIEELEVALKKTKIEKSHLEGELESENNNSEELLSNLQSQLEEKDIRIDELDTELNAILNERVKLEHMYSQECSRSADLEVQLRCKEEELEMAQRDAEIERVDMQEVIDSLETECKTHRAAVDDQVKQIERLHGSLREGGDDAELLAEEVIRYHQELHAAAQTIKDQDEAATFLQNRVSELEHFYSRTKEKLETMVHKEASSSASTSATPVTPVANEEITERSKRLTLMASELASQRKDTRLVTVEKASPSMEKALRMSAGALLIENVLHNREKATLGRTFRQWSTATSTLRAVSQHVHVAEIMNRQLQTTREKLAKLKSHLKSEQKKRVEQLLAQEFRAGWSPH